jgi:carbon-monoxide dehydrogenase large subunit
MWRSPGRGSAYGNVAVDDAGRARVSAGTRAHGQSHATAFPLLVADRLKMVMDRMRHVQSDTAVVAHRGTGGSRSRSFRDDERCAAAVVIGGPAG